MRRAPLAGLVDLVVRDKKDAILRGLTSADLEVYEDGGRPAVESLEFVERDGGEKGQAAPAAPSTAASPPGNPSPTTAGGDELRLTLSDGEDEQVRTASVPVPP